MHFRKKRDSCNDLFINNTILSDYELHLYELLKLVLKSLYGHHWIKFCNDMFRKQNKCVNTRISTLNLLNIPLKKSKVERNSVQFRSSVLYNKLRLIRVFPDNVENVIGNDLSDICQIFQIEIFLYL